MIGFLSGRQTHSLVAHLIDNSVRGQKIDLFGYTFDHPEISQALTRAALRGVFVRLTLNAEEVEGKSSTREAVPVITEMLRRCEEARRDPDAEFDCTLEVWKQEGQRIASVYSAWGRRTRVALQKRGPLHAKVFVLGPAVRVPSDDDNRVMVMGSTNSTISSESNVELSVALQIGKEGAGESLVVVVGLLLSLSRLLDDVLEARLVLVYGVLLCGGMEHELLVLRAHGLYLLLSLLSVVADHVLSVLVLDPEGDDLVEGRLVLCLELAADVLGELGCFLGIGELMA